GGGCGEEQGGERGERAPGEGTGHHDLRQGLNGRGKRAYTITPGRSGTRDGEQGESDKGQGGGKGNGTRGPPPHATSILGSCHPLVPCPLSLVPGFASTVSLRPTS